MFLTDYLPLFSCLAMLWLAWIVTKIADSADSESQSVSAGLKTRVVIIFIGLIMAIGIPIYFKATLEIGDYWTVPLILFGSLLSLNAIWGIFVHNLQAPVLGTAWWSLGLAVVFQFLLFAYSHEANPNAFINPPAQTGLYKVLIFILLSLSGICFLYFLLFQRNPKEVEYQLQISQVKKRLEVVGAFLGLIVTLAQITNHFINLWTILGVDKLFR